jgi:hypothetical protein
LTSLLDSIVKLLNRGRCIRLIIAEHLGKKKMMFYPVIDAFQSAKNIQKKYSEMQTEDVCC